MVVWDLVQETLKARGFYNLVMQWAWRCVTHSSRRKTKLITGDNRSMIDYLMVRKTDRCLVKGVKVISSEESVPQHRMVINDLSAAYDTVNHRLLIRKLYEFTKNNPLCKDIQKYAVK